MSTLLRAILSGRLLTPPGLTIGLIMKHLPNSIATNIGHQDKEAKNLRSTQAPATYTSPVDPGLTPLSKARSHNICIMLLPSSTILKSYSDQTGKFPTISSCGNQYIFFSQTLYKIYSRHCNPLNSLGRDRKSVLVS